MALARAIEQLALEGDEPALAQSYRSSRTLSRREPHTCLVVPQAKGPREVLRALTLELAASNVYLLAKLAMRKTLA